MVLYKSIIQGITTVITGNCGISAAPVTLKKDVPNQLNLIGEKDILSWLRRFMRTFSIQ